MFICKLNCISDNAGRVLMGAALTVAMLVACSKHYQPGFYSGKVQKIEIVDGFFYKLKPIYVAYLEDGKIALFGGECGSLVHANFDVQFHYGPPVEAVRGKINEIFEDGHDYWVTEVVGTSFRGANSEKVDFATRTPCGSGLIDDQT